MRHQVEQAPGGGHHHIGSAAQGHHLRVDRHPAMGHHHFQAQSIRHWVHHLAHLHRQLAGGHQHQTADGPAEIGLSGRLQNFLHQGQDIRQGFARSCGRTGPHIAALQHGRDGLRLNGRGQVQAHAVHGAHQRRAQAEFREVQKRGPVRSGGWIGDVRNVLPTPYMQTITRIRGFATIHQGWLKTFATCKLLPPF